jgi:hypothetical protein
MCAHAVYRWRPSGTFSLLAELARRPTTVNVTPEEDQLTIVLAWLCDNSTAIAAALANAFVSGDLDGVGAVSKCGTFSAQVQPWLPPLNGFLGRADLSLTGEDHIFQLLIEAKLGSDFALYTVAGTSVSQPDAYIVAWERSHNPTNEAHVRRVGTIRLEGDAPSSIGHGWRARDLMWKDVHDLLRGLLDTGALSTEVRLIAGDLQRYLGHRVLRPAVDANELEHGRRLVQAICERLSVEFPGASVGHVATREKDEHAGVNLKSLPTKYGEAATFWIAFTPAATRYNVPGWPSVVHLDLIEPWDDDRIVGCLVRSGFEYERDRSQRKFLGVQLLIDPSPDDPLDSQVDVAVQQAVAVLSDIFGI